MGACQGTAGPRRLVAQGKDAAWSLRPVVEVIEGSMLNVSNRSHSLRSAQPS